jgi:hypothetical protein
LCGANAASCDAYYRSGMFQEFHLFVNGKIKKLDKY